MKKKLAIAALVLTIGVGSLVVNADSPLKPNINPGERNPNFTIEERNVWRKERHSYRKDELEKALKDGEITQAEFQEWEEHFKYMEEFHKKNKSFNNNFMMNRGHGGCGGNRMGKGRMRNNR